MIYVKIIEFVGKIKNSQFRLYSYDLLECGRPIIIFELSDKLPTNISDIIQNETVCNIFVTVIDM